MAETNGSTRKKKTDGTRKKALTEYHVFRQVKAREMVEGGPTEVGPDSFEFIATVTAGSESAAKMAVFAEAVKASAAAGGGELVETLVAAPVRSWKPKRYRAVNQPKIVVE
jgi:hypothetical protein